jgi:hypothetical protein
MLLPAMWPTLLRGKAGRCMGLTTLTPSYADCLEILEPQPPGTLRACPGLYRDCHVAILVLMVKLTPMDGSDFFIISFYNINVSNICILHS